MTNDGPPTRAQRFAAIVKPAAIAAGYTGRGAKAQLARDTGISESTINLLWQGKRIPEPQTFERLAEVVRIDLRDLLIEADIVSATSLTETGPSQVRSQPIAPEDAADELGISDPVGREMFLAMVERLRRQEQETQRTPETAQGGGTAAER